MSNTVFTSAIVLPLCVCVTLPMLQKCTHCLPPNLPTSEVFSNHDADACAKQGTWCVLSVVAFFGTCAHTLVTLLCEPGFCTCVPHLNFTAPCNASLVYTKHKTDCCMRLVTALLEYGLWTAIAPHVSCQPWTRQLVWVHATTSLAVVWSARGLAH